MKEQEEKEQNGEVTPNTVSPVKAGEMDSDGVESAKEPDSTGPEEVSASGSHEESGPDLADSTETAEGKESQGSETAQGALGQVKAKVEVCKDEAVGKKEMKIFENFGDTDQQFRKGQIQFRN